MDSEENTLIVKRELTAFEAKNEAQKLAFAPVVFQVVVAMQRLGILPLICKNRKGISLKEISNKTNVSIYGVKVLLEMAANADIVKYIDDQTVTVTMLGYFLNSDEMTRVNINFTNDVCYDGFKFLTESIQNGKPEGLKTLGNWPTIYPALSSLPEKIKKSWFEFDHFYSDEAFRDALNIVFKEKPATIFDIGGNTGKWAFASCEFNADVHVKILDLPQQIAVAKANAEKRNLADRISYFEINLLDNSQKIPKGADVVWMSQFLDCFGEDEIVAILENVRQAASTHTTVFILEPFIDNQKFEAASYCLTATSLYFTALANGNSKMYSVKAMAGLVEKAGLEVVETFPLIGESFHTILKCKVKA
ncbi:MAG TPA: class I SAM-dependent methyltransferase [Bacteroidia bacterium]|jgi:hypothetical protein|nr:class I SAM-dependent methyltransferase [Bacteroidia bacterium]HMU19064.1 class I SAM-dependent methyltransferase [Bacteroidia bacterium]